MATIPLQYVASLSHLNVSGYTVIVDVVAGCRLSVRVFDVMPKNRGQAVVGVVVAVENGVQSLPPPNIMTTITTKANAAKSTQAPAKRAHGTLNISVVPSCVTLDLPSCSISSSGSG